MTTFLRRKRLQRDWNSSPQEIDRSNPLSDGALGVFTFSPELRGMANSGDFGEGTVVGGPKFEEGLTFTTGSSRIEFPSSHPISSFHVKNNSFTLIFSIEFSTLPSTDGTIFGIWGGAGDNTLLVWLDVGEGVKSVAVVASSSGGSFINTGETSGEVLSNKKYIYAITGNGEKVSIYRDGVLLNSGTGGPITINDSSSFGASFGTERNGSTVRQLETCGIEFLLPYDRALSPEEAEEISADPYQVLKTHQAYYNLSPSLLSIDSSVDALIATENIATVFTGEVSVSASTSAMGLTGLDATIQSSLAVSSQSVLVEEKITSIFAGINLEVSASQSTISVGELLQSIEIPLDISVTSESVLFAEKDSSVFAGQNEDILAELQATEITENDTTLFIGENQDVVTVTENENILSQDSSVFTGLNLTVSATTDARFFVEKGSSVFAGNNTNITTSPTAPLSLIEKGTSTFVGNNINITTSQLSSLSLVDGVLQSINYLQRVRVETLPLSMSEEGASVFVGENLSIPSIRKELTLNTTPLHTILDGTQTYHSIKIFNLQVNNPVL